MPLIEMLKWSNWDQQGAEIFILVSFTGFSSDSVSAGTSFHRENLDMDFFFGFVLDHTAVNAQTPSLESFYRYLRFMFLKQRQDLKMWKNYLRVSKFTVDLCSCSTIFQSRICWFILLLPFSVFSVIELCLIRIKSKSMSTQPAFSVYMSSSFRLKQLAKSWAFSREKEKLNTLRQCIHIFEDWTHPP